MIVLLNFGVVSLVSIMARVLDLGLELCGLALETLVLFTSLAEKLS